MSEVHSESQNGRRLGGLSPAYVETEAVRLDLEVNDPEVAAALRAQRVGPQRNRFALTALRIGVAALSNAAGEIDADKVRHEGTRLLDHLQGTLKQHRETVMADLTGRLQEYFDPESGRFEERLARLVRRDGELEQLLRRQVASGDSELARTLDGFVGHNSELRRLLSGEGPDSLPNRLQQMTSTMLNEHRERILGEFSLDRHESALSRLLRELRERHGEMSRDVRGTVDKVIGEFSLDREDSALSRLVGRVEHAQQQISSEFSLDAKDSALARLKREIETLLVQHRDENERFRGEVREALVEMKARRRESLRSTRHGGDFEQDLCSQVRARLRSGGDIVDHVGNETGVISHCKKGDIVVTLGTEQRAAGARIVIEAKQAGGYTATSALAELDEARKNREAQVGVFVLSARVAPEGVEPVARHGNDLLVIWDPEQPDTDIYLNCALSLASALCSRVAARRHGRAVDVDAFNSAVREIEKQLAGLEEIRTWAATVSRSGDKIRKKAETIAKKLARQVEELDRRTQDLRQLTQDATVQP